MFNAIQTSTQMRGELKPGARKPYALAGKATVTLRSMKTGTRFTYRIKKHKTEELYFVGVLNGPDNTNNYQYLGTIFPEGFSVTRKSQINFKAPSAVAFHWFAKNMEHAAVEVWHEGACGKCGRKLTVPESIESGLGPTCASRHEQEPTHPLKAAVTRALKTQEYKQLAKIAKATGTSLWSQADGDQFSAERSDLAVSGRVADCPKCGKTVSGTLHEVRDRENEITHHAGVHPCGAHLTVFNE